MNELNDEEFKKFILDNKDRILNILQENLPDSDDVDRAFEYADKAKAKVSEKKDAVEDVAKQVYTAFTAPEVHKHFIKMGMELFMGLNEIADRLPVPDSVRKVRDDMGRTETEIRKEMCRNNPDCMKKNVPKEPAGLERIELE